MEQTTIASFTIFYSNLAELYALKKEIFINEEYKTKLNKPNPLIIDCGSHIGLSILYFKKLYPQAKIIGFEPDPVNFEILQKNIAVNTPQNVTAIQAALAANEGAVTFYKTSDPDKNFSWHNTTAVDFQRTGSEATSVPAVKLSNFLNQPVDLLKMDIEGSELEVLQEIKEKLGNIKQIILEYHGLPQPKNNRFSDVLKIIKKNSSNVIVLDKKPTFKNWRWEFFKKTGFPLFRIKNPYYFIIKARR